MPGMVELGEEVFHMPVRLGNPKYTGRWPMSSRTRVFATAFGLLLEAQTQRKRGLKMQREARREAGLRPDEVTGLPRISEQVFTNVVACFFRRRAMFEIIDKEEVSGDRVP